MTADDRESRLAADRLSDALEEVGRLEAARQAQADVMSRLLADRADARRRLAAAEEELAAIHALRLWKWSAPPRRVYGWARRRLRPRSPG